jgi:hypothetical protein
VLVDPTGIAVAIADSLQRNTVITYDGTNFFVIWQDKRNGSYDIYGARVGQSGIVLDPDGIAVSTAANDQINPSVGFNGTDFVAIWEDSRNGPPTDIYGALVNTSGVVVDSFAIVTQAGAQIYPTVAHGSASQALVAYAGWAANINAHPANAMRTWGTFYPPTGITQQDTGFEIRDTRFTLTVSPNPFTHFTEIRYSIMDTRYSMKQETHTLELQIYDATGRLIRSFNLESSIQHQGSAVSWIGTDSSGRKLPSGVYFLKLVVGDYSATEKILLVR